MTGRPYSSGSLSLADGGIRAYLHIKRLRRLAAKLPDQAKMLLAAADAMQRLSARNRRLGQQVGAAMGKGVLTSRGASLPVANPDTPAVIADLASDKPVTAYVARRNARRIRVTTRHDRVPVRARVIGRYDENTDYRAIVADVRRVACAT